MEDFLSQDDDFFVEQFPELIKRRKFGLDDPLMWPSQNIRTHVLHNMSISWTNRLQRR